VRRKDMPNDSLIMLKKTLITNLISGALIIIFSFIKLKSYSYIFAIGLLLGELNLIINIFVTNFILEKSYNYAQFYIVSFIIRISFIAIIGFIFFTHNIYSTVAYISGYTSHFIGIFIYSHGIKNYEKGCD
jgi:ATP synthase protein I